MNYRAIAVGLVLACSIPVHAQESQRQYLSGKGIDDAVQWEFMVSAGNKSGSWTTIAVPWCWDTLGFGQLTFGRGEPPSTEQGKYRHKFQVPANWNGQRIYLVFEGSMTDTEAWVNGTSAGPKHEGSYYRFSYDVTASIKPGQENLLEVTVDKESANQSVNRAERRADYWDYGGIFRPVYLEARPQQHIDRVAIDAKHTGDFAMDVFGTGITSATAVQAQLMDLAGNAVGTPFSQPIADGKAHLTFKLDAAKQWTAETPNLYQVQVTLLQGQTPLHQLKQRFGFRTIELRAGDGIYVNNQRVTLKGTNRHSFWPESGRATSLRISKLDVQVMKDMNCNAVRMSHYPPDDHFLDVCDEMGLYVLDELAGWQQSYDTPTARRLIEAMVTHDVNHPSILFWDNGNEQGRNRNNEVNDDFAKWDIQKREVMHPQTRFRNIDATHYPNYTRVQQLAAGEVVFINTEILHGLFDGGLGAGLTDYWEVMHKSKVFGGMFLWAYADETIKRIDKGGMMDGAGNQAPDGIVGPYREKEGSYFTAKEIWSPIVVTMVSPTSLHIENRFDFIDAGKCTYTIQWRKFSLPSDAKAGFSVVAERKILQGANSIPPHQQADWSISPPPEAAQANAISVRVDDPDGRELWTWVWPLQTSIYAAPTVAAGPAIIAKEDGSSIEVNTGGLALRFSKETGYLTSATRGANSFSLVNGPRLATGNAKLEKIEHRAAGGSYVVDITYSGDMKSARWTIQPNGWVQLNYSYNLTGPHDFFGVSFDLAEAKVKSKKWLGYGPFHVWQNRMNGGSLNVWENAYNNTQTGYTDWVYPEFKGYFSGVRWMSLETTDGPILMVPGDPSLYVQVLKTQFPGDPKPGGNAQQMLSGNSWAQFPEAGLSVLHAIPPIGSKFNGPESTGPRGRKAVANGEYQGSVSFYFGALPGT